MWVMKRLTIKLLAVTQNSRMICNCKGSLYSYASNLMEKQKQAMAKGSQWAKALLSKLHDTNN